ncbi:hypothetical protein F9L33_05695 [Amylibacter sp. SFDW26]|uniref:hypothetical protein n=1 Tax=Amylibacter sp. SFDW26 TaxID=2652722 RepID=UPI001262A789|nr:hypothetical protein [Amylibacter sp. SFDW26]KAB7616242.1 hypothetical protein F9L33_05695 [Amylibacter sp. SFDW26]
MQSLLKIVFFILIFTTSASAKNFKLDPSSVVLVQEIDITSVWLCPVSQTGQFETHCKRNNHLYFYLEGGRRDFITEGKTGYYGVKSIKSKKAGRYAYTLGRITSGSNITTYSIKDETMIADVSSGTVLIMPYSYGLPRKTLNKILKQVKSIFRKRYGSVADQMTYKIMETKKISCTKSKIAFNSGQSCTLR